MDPSGTEPEEKGSDEMPPAVCAKDKKQAQDVDHEYPPLLMQWSFLSMYAMTISFYEFVNFLFPCRKKCINAIDNPMMALYNKHR
jgi:hypothetical protein